MSDLSTTQKTRDVQIRALESNSVVSPPNNELNKNANFDFEDKLEPEDRDFLQDLDKQMWKLYSNYSVDVGELLSKAQGRFSNQGSRSDKHGSATFTKWIDAWGFSKNKAYDYIRQFNFVRQAHEVGTQNEQDLISTFEKLPEKAKTKVASKSVDPAFRELVMSSNVTTNPQYLQLLKQYKAAQTENTELRNREPETVVKAPADYAQIQRERTQLIEELNDKKQKVADIQTKLKQTTNPDDYEEVKDKVKKYEEDTNSLNILKAQIDEMYAEKDELGKNVNAFKKVLDLEHDIVPILNSISPLTTSPYVQELTHEDMLKTSIPEIINQLDRISDAFKKLVAGTTIIDVDFENVNKN